jgi:hypothetical protein
MEHLYSTAEWLDLSARAKARDGHRCTVARLLGGPCSDTLHAHHLIPVSEGGPELPDLDGVITACASHHPVLEALRRFILGRRRPKIRPCRHLHRYPQGRVECRRQRLAEAGIASDGSLEDERRIGVAA